MGRSSHTLQHDGVRSQTDGSCLHVLTLGDSDLFGVGLKAYISDSQRKGAITRCLDGESSVHVRHGVGYYLFTTKKSCCGLDHCVLGILFNDRSTDGPLCERCKCRNRYEQ